MPSLVTYPRQIHRPVSQGSLGAVGSLVARASEAALNPTAAFGVSLGSQAPRHVLTVRRQRS
jgi:hypothetical protein